MSLHICAVWSVFIVCMKKLYILGCPKYALGRFRSDSANAESALNLLWAHCCFIRFIPKSAPNHTGRYIVSHYSPYDFTVHVITCSNNRYCKNTKYSDTLTPHHNCSKIWTCNLLPVVVFKSCRMNGKQCRPLWDTLFAQACLSEYLW